MTIGSQFQQWVRSLGDARFVELFDVDGAGRVRTQEIGRTRMRRVLCRSTAMEAAMIDVVQRGLADDEWLGLLYVMGWGDRSEFRPLYVGRTGRFGKTPGKVSANLERIETDRGKFARWGNGNAYHVGDLSDTLFVASEPSPRSQKYERWAELLFDDRSVPRLRYPTSLLIVPWRTTTRTPSGWPTTLEDAEEELIDLALAEFEEIVLNVAGETWWAPRASEARSPDAVRPTRPVRFVESASSLEAIVSDLVREPIVGLDVETTMYEQRLCLVQLGGREFTAVVDVDRVGDLRPLSQLLGNEKVEKVIHNASFERRILGAQGLEVAPVFDTLRASRQLYGRAMSHRLDAVVGRELGIVLDKSMQTSTWDRRPLSQAQLDYAALDAEVLVELHGVLSAKAPQNSLAFD